MEHIKISAGSPDKVNGKLVKYKRGDCLCINCGNKNFIAAIISEKFGVMDILGVIFEMQRSSGQNGGFLFSMV